MAKKKEVPKKHRHSLVAMDNHLYRCQLCNKIFTLDFMRHKMIEVYFEEKN